MGRPGVGGFSEVPELGKAPKLVGNLLEGGRQKERVGSGRGTGRTRREYWC